MAVPPDDLFHQQERELLRYTDSRVSLFLKRLEEARRELLEAIGAPDSYETQRLLNLIAQVDEIGLRTQADLLQMPNAAPELARLSREHLTRSISAVSGLEVSIAFDALNTDVLQRFSENELKHVTGLVAAEKEKIKSVLFTKIGVKGENPARVARQLAGSDSSFAGRFGHVETILRTETSTIYNAQSLAAIQDANTNYELNLNKRIIETLDAKRNHPISLVLNGMVQEVGKPFKVKVSAVQAAASRLKKGRGTGGIFWPKVGEYYVGEKLPAHYRERGIIVPTEKPVTPVP